MRSLLAVSLRFLATGLTFLNSLMIARAVGVAEAGAFFACVSAAQLFSPLFARGYPEFSLFWVARMAKLHGTDATVNIALRRLLPVAVHGILGGISIVAIGLLGDQLCGNTEMSDLPALLFSAVYVGMCKAAVKCIADVVKGSGRTLTGLGLEYNVEPLALQLLLHTLLPSHNGTLPWALTALVLSHSTSLAAALIGVVGNARTRPPAAPQLVAEYTEQESVRRRPIFWENLLNMVIWTTPTIAIAFFLSRTDAGLFSAAQRISGLGTIIIVAISSQFSAGFARDSGISGDAARLKASLKRAQLTCLAAYLPIWIAVLLFSQQILALWGPQFIPAKGYLLFLCTVQLISSYVGVATDFLKMTGQQHVVFRISLITVAATCGDSLWVDW